MWLQQLRRLLSLPARNRPAPTRRRTTRLALEALEDRYVLSPTLTLSGPDRLSAGAAYPLTLGPVLDADPHHVVSQYVVHWGDNTTSTYSAASLPPNRTITHTYGGGVSTPQISVDLVEQAGFVDQTFGGGKVIAPQDGYSRCYAAATDPANGELVMFDVGLGANLHWFESYKPDGSPDGSFGRGSGFVPFDGAVQMQQPDLAVDASGRLLVAGYLFDALGANVHTVMAVARYNADGSRDQSFGANGLATVNLGPLAHEAYSVAVDQQGRILLAGGSVAGGTVVRLTSTGALDPSFGTAGSMAFPTAFTAFLPAVAVDPTTGGFVVFSQTGPGYQFLHYQANGGIDTSFGGGTGAVRFAGGLVPQSGGLAVDGSGRLLVTGSTIGANGTQAFAVERTNVDGNPDASFGSNGVAVVDFGALPGQANSVSVDARGRVLLAGYVQYSGVDLPALAALIGAPGGPFLDVATKTISPLRTVTNLGDSPTFIPGDGSLRGEIAVAQAGDVIQFSPALAGGTITLQNGQLELSKDLTIQGPVGGLTVSGNQQTRVFFIDAGVTASLSGLTIANGSVSPEGGGDINADGGGLVNLGTLALTNCTLANDLAGLNGGGIENAGGTLTITGCTIISCSASGAGGIDSTGGTVTLLNSTLVGNNAGTASGGAIENEAGSLSLVQCTVTANQDGIFLSSEGGGGIGNNGNLFLANTLVAGNTNLLNAPDDIAGPVTANYSLIGATTNAVISGGHNLLDVSPLLGPLANNGGPTQTCALLPGSPAIDAGSNSLAVDASGTLLATDQRGFARSTGAAVDIGAVEYGYDLDIDSLTEPAQIYSGGSVLLTLVVNNLGPDAAAAVLTASLPPGAVLQSVISPPGWALTTSNGNGQTTLSAILNPGQTLAPGASAIFTLTAQVSGPGGSLVTGNASVGPTTWDVNPTNNVRQLSVLIRPASITTLTPAGANDSAVFGQTVPFTATVSASNPSDGTPAGTVDLFEDGRDVASQPLDSTGTAVFQVSGLHAGSHDLKAVYHGNSTLPDSTSPDVSFQITPATPVVVVQPVTALFDGQFHGTTGEVYGVGNVDLGRASIGYGPSDGNTAPVHAGSYTATGSFPGNQDYTSATGVAEITIVQAAPTVLVPPVTVTYDGQAHGTTAEAYGVGGIALSPAIVSYSSGSTPVHAGSYTATGSFPGNQDYLSATGTAAITVRQATPVLTWNAPAPISYGTPLGTGQLNAVANVPGTLAYSPPAGTALGVGMHTLSATFTPSDAIDYTSATASAPLTVNQNGTLITLTSSASLTFYGELVTFKAVVEPIMLPSVIVPTGAVTFETDQGTILGTAVLDATGTAVLSGLSTLPVGSTTILARYGGDGGFLASEPVALAHTVSPNETLATLGSSASPSVYGELITLSATVTPAFPAAVVLVPTGTVTFTDDTSLLGAHVLGTAALDATGKAVLPNVSGLILGSHTILATYGGDGGFLASEPVALAQTVNSLSAASLQQQLASGATVTLVATNDADAIAAVAAVVGLAAVATPVTVQLDLAGGAYSDVVASPPAGVTLVINGNGSTTTIVGHSPALTVAAGTVVVQGVTLTTATDAPTIQVTGGGLVLRNDVIQESTGFTDAALAVTGGSVDLGTTTSPGNNVINVNGAGEFVQATAGSVAAASVTYQVNGVPLAASTLSVTTLTSSAPVALIHQPVLLTAVVRGNGPGANPPGGTVDFVDVSTSTDLGRVPLVNGTASFTTQGLAVGNHLIRAFYSGDGTFTPSLDAVAQQVSYRVAVLFDQTQPHQPGSTIPIRLMLTDFYGADVSSPNLPVTATGVAPASSPSAVQPPLAAGNANPGNVFRYDEGAYQYNLKTSRDMAAGTWLLFFTVADDPLVYSVQFQIS